MPDRCPVCKTQLAPESRFCHHCGAPLAGKHPRKADQQVVDVARALILTTCLAWTIGWAGSFADAEAFTVLGFISTLLGVVMIYLGVHIRYVWSVILGMAHGCMFGLSLALIGIFDWSVAEGQKPMLVLGSLYLLLLLPFSVHAWRRAPALRHPWECRKCGYLLYGLTEPRCPECGTLFDPARVTPPMPPNGEPPPLE